MAGVRGIGPLHSTSEIESLPLTYAPTTIKSLLGSLYYGLKPSPPSSVIVSPVIYLKSGEANWTQTLPISSSLSPKCPHGGVFTFALNASG